MATIARTLSYPVIACALDALDSREMELRVEVYVRMVTQYAYFRLRIGDVYSNYRALYLGSYEPGSRVEAVLRPFTFSHLPCDTLSIVRYDYETGGVNATIPVEDGELIIAGCRGLPSDTCVVETDGGSAVSVPIVDADGDGVGTGVVGIIVSGNGTVTVKGTASIKAVASVGKVPPPLYDIVVQVAEIPYHEMFVDLRAFERMCATLYRTPSVSLYPYTAFILYPAQAR